MSTPHARASPPSTETQVLRGVDQLCDQFEAAWRAGREPRIEDYVAGASGDTRTRLLRELVALDVAYRRQCGASVVGGDYEARFPKDVAIVREGIDCGGPLPAAASPAEPAAASGSAPSSGRLTVRCPSCHSPMQVAVDTALTYLTCASCGSHFSLVDQGQATRLAPPLSTLGHFELIERLGVGSFGSVWKARDTQLDRTVAIKIPRRQLMSAEEQERFFHEARAAAQLHHANIVSVHEVGRDGDAVYIVTDLVHGVTLGDWLTGQTLTAREAAQLCVTIADALHHAHEEGVVHRDLKPANVMIDDDGQPHLMDFGLARREVGEVTVTLDGQILGTPAYMSPEQAQGEAHVADRRSDVYSLGVILFQLLTGELPFRGNPRMVIYQVIHADPPGPRGLNAHVPTDLETITLKCLEKDPKNRYPTAGVLAEELRRWLRGEPIQARPLGRLEKASRWTRKHPLEVTLAAIVVALAVGGPLVAARQHQLASEKNTALAESEKTTDFALAMLQTPSRFDPGYDSQDLNIADLFQQAADRVDERFSEQPVLAARFQFALAKTLCDLGEYQLAEDLAQQSVKSCRAAHDASPETTLLAERLVAVTRQKLGHHVEARRQFQELASRAKIALGSTHPTYLVLCTDVATAYAQNQQPQALEWIEKAAPCYRTVLAEAHPDRRLIANRTGWVYCMLGRYDIGLEYFEEALRLRRRYDGRLNHATLRVQHANLAWALTCLGRHEEAIANQREALALFREKYPDDPRRWLWPQSYLIHRYVRAEQFNAAIAAAQEFLNTCRQCRENPDDHESWTVWELHDALYRVGRQEAAKQLTGELTDCLRDVQGEDDLAVERAALRHLRTACRYDDVDPDVEVVVSRLWDRFRAQRGLPGANRADVAATADVLAGGLTMIVSNPVDQWRELQEWFDLSSAQTPDDPWNLYRSAMVSLAQRDATEYRRRCATLLFRFPRSDRAAAERVVHACVAAPDSTPNPEEVVRFARVTEQPRLVGAALYRAKEYGQALDAFNQAADAGWQLVAWDYAFRAMSLHRRDRDGEALQSLLMAQQLSSQVSSWHEEVELASVIQEAEALLDSERAAITSNE